MTTKAINPETAWEAKRDLLAPMITDGTLDPVALATGLLAQDPPAREEAVFLFGEAAVLEASAALRSMIGAAKSARVKASAEDPNKATIRKLSSVAWCAMLEHYGKIRTPAMPTDLAQYLAGIAHPGEPGSGTVLRGVGKRRADGTYAEYRDLSGTPKGTFGCKVAKWANRAINLSVRYDAKQISRSGEAEEEEEEFSRSGEEEEEFSRSGEEEEEEGEE